MSGIDNQKRFFDVMECFKDDMRVAAFALKEFSEINDDVILIYHNLLGGHYLKYLDSLDSLTYAIPSNVLNNFILVKQYIFDHTNNIDFKIDDSTTIARSGWKFLENEEIKIKKEVKIKYEISLLDFMEEL